jgi:hypothetical protein
MLRNIYDSNTLTVRRPPPPTLSDFLRNTRHTARGGFHSQVNRSRMRLHSRERQQRPGDKECFPS